MTSCSSKENLYGFWSGEIILNKKSLDIEIYISKDKSYFTCIELEIISLPIKDLVVKKDKINFFIQPGAVKLIFNGKTTRLKINGEIIDDGEKSKINIYFNIERKGSEEPTINFNIEDVEIQNGDILLKAQVFSPKNEFKHPALVLLHGSQLNLKDQYLFEADFYTKLGFEVLIFDKRGCGESTGSIEAATNDDLISDAIACLKFMRRRKSVDEKKVGVWGYSQGATLLPLVSDRSNIPSFLIAKSPEIVSIVEAAAFQDSIRVIKSGYSNEEGHIVAQSHKKIEYMINHNASIKQIKDYIKENANTYKFMNMTGLYGSLDINEAEYGSYYWKGRVFNFKPYWKNLVIPTLILWGENDELLNSIKNEAIIKSFCLDNIDPVIFKGADHNIKTKFDPTDKDTDWPKAAKGYYNYIENWLIGRNILIKN